MIIECTQPSISMYFSSIIECGKTNARKLKTSAETAKPCALRFTCAFFPRILLRWKNSGREQVYTNVILMTYFLTLSQSWLNCDLNFSKLTTIVQKKNSEHKGVLCRYISHSTMISRSNVYSRSSISFQFIFVQLDIPKFVTLTS